MPQSPLENVEAHWHKLIENFQTTSLGFYSSVEAALERRRIPGLKTSRVLWSEGGVLSPEREYLRVTGDRHSFDMCAAPFGTGFFFSSWMTKKKARFVLLYLSLIASLTLLIGWGLQQGLNMALNGMGGWFLRSLAGPFVLLPVAFLIVLWLIALTARGGRNGPEAAILTVPLIGWFYQTLFVPETYYRIDTMLMFQSAVHAAMHDAINERLTQKGLRALGDNERKPVFRELLMSGRSEPDPSQHVVASPVGANN